MDAITVGFLAYLGLLTFVLWEEIPHAGGYLAMDGLLILVVAALTRLPLDRGVAVRRVRLLYPIVVVPLIFSQLQPLVPAATTMDLDWWLIRWDQWLFGVQPAAALQVLHHPVLTDLLQIVYSSFYFLPVGVGAVLLARGRVEELDRFAFLITYGFFLSYLGYFLVPSLGPRFTITDQFDGPLVGWWVHQPLSDFLNRLEGVHRDCFPSGHTMITALTVWAARRLTPRLFPAYLVIGLLLLFSTMYLRYHYGVDILAGLLWAGFALFSAPRLYDLLIRLAFGPPEPLPVESPHRPPVS